MPGLVSPVGKDFDLQIGGGHAGRPLRARRCGRDHSRALPAIDATFASASGIALRLGVACIDEDRLAAGGFSALDIFASVADHVAAVQVDPVFARGAHQQARLWLAAIAAVGVVVRTR